MESYQFSSGAWGWQVRVAAALSRIAAQGDQSFEGGEERVLKWDKARRDREKSSEGELLNSDRNSAHLLLPCIGRLISKHMTCLPHL